jgi:hypothetical protein
MDDLIAFVKARLDDTETLAEAALEGLPDEYVGDVTREQALAMHILADVKAKQPVLEWYAEAAEASALFREKLGTGTHMAVAAESYLNVIRVYAALCDDHPDYRVEWAPPGG